MRRRVCLRLRRQRRGGRLDRSEPGGAWADIIGTVGGGTEYFRISINPATGVVTFSQSQNVWHADTISDDDTSTLTLANAALLQLVRR